MKTFNLFVILASLCLSSTNANASNEPNAHITSYIPQAAGQMFFTTDGQRTGVPSCSIQPGRWVIDDTTSAGQAMVAGMLSAYALGKTLTLVGSGNCSVWGDTETVAYFYVF